MKFTDVFISKPVLAIVVSLFIFLLGLRSATELNVRQFPQLQNAVVTVTTTYVGADADLIQGFVTTPLEREIAAADGIDYLTSTSLPGVSTIQAFLRLDYDPNAALTQIAAQVNKVRRDLPEESEDPVVELAVGQTIAAMYMSFYSDLLDSNQITDYLIRVVEPQLSTVPGVQRAQILGARTFAMRVWLDSDRMTAAGVTGADVFQALQANNVLSAVGATKGQMVEIDLTAQTDLHSAEEFRRMNVRSANGSIVRLEDVADVELGAENYQTSATFDGENATFIGVEVAPDANALEVVERVREVWDQRILPQLPDGLNAAIPYDSTEYIQSAINEVVLTIVLALVIVIVVIFLFLGSLRSVIIPAISIPLSLVGTFFLMWMMGFSINLLTLLAMVLAIGIVVDDAIIVLENVHRHMENGMGRLQAALRGARELAWPIVAMSTTLVAVYLPIGFVGGLTGTLFIEFAFTLAASVILSGVVALTLSPMMCSRILPPTSGNGNRQRLAKWLDARFDGLRRRYQRRLHGALEEKRVVLVFGLIVLGSCYFLFVTSSEELEPPEDQGFIFSIAQGDAFATLDYTEKNSRLFNVLAEETPEIRNLFVVNGAGGGGAAAGANNAIAGFVLEPWENRNRTTQQVLEESIEPGLQKVPGMNIFALVPPSLPAPGGGGPPVQFVVGSTQPIENLLELGSELVDRGMESGRFIFLDTDLKIDKPRMEVVIDRDKAALLGISMRQLSMDLSALMSGGFAGRFSMANRSYRIVPQVERGERLNPDQLERFHTRTGTGELIPLSTVVRLEETVEPQQLKRFQQLNSITLSGVPRPGVTLGEALDILDAAAAEILPEEYSVDYAGQSRQFRAEGAQLVVTFFFALIVIYLVLAAQFESFRDPLIMLVTVPMSVCGAMIFVSLGITTINIYTQVGLVTLIGLISKHGILIVEFANQLQREGLSRREAIEEASAIRLRPILMTTAATVLAMVPLLLAGGAGGGARFAMGMVIASGMTIGTLFTLFVVPAIYLYLARDHQESKAEVVADEVTAKATS